MGSVGDLLFRMHQRGVKIWSDRGQLRYAAPPGRLDPGEIVALRERKSEIVEFLESRFSVPMEPPLRPRSPGDRVPLTFSQLWMWNTLKLDELPTKAGIIVRALRLAGRLNVPALCRSFASLVHRHEALRTRLVKVDGLPTQRIDEKQNYELVVADSIGIRRNARDLTRIAEEFVYGSSPEEAGPLFSARLIECGRLEHVLIVAIDHIVSDGASIGILFRDLFSLYAKFSSESSRELPDVPMQFPDYAVWQLATQEIWAQRHYPYWKERLAGMPDARLSIGDTNARLPMIKLPLQFDRGTSTALRESSQRARTTLVMGVLTAFVVSVMHLYGCWDIIIPFISSGRLYPEVANTVGFFGVPIFLRVTLLRTDRFLDLLQRVTGEYANACEHHDSCRIAAQTPEPEFTWNPTFNWLPEMNPMETMASVECGDVVAIEPCELEIDPPEDFRWNGQLRVDFRDTAAGLTGVIGYRTDSFPRTAMERFRSLLHLFAGQLARDPEQRIGTVVPFER